MATRIESLRSGCPSADEHEPVIELKCFREDLVSKQKVSDSDHQRLRRLLEQLDDDAIVAEGKSTNAGLRFEPDASAAEIVHKLERV